jgi:hypothetical protein
VISKIGNIQSDKRVDNQNQALAVNRINQLISLPLNQGSILQNVSLDSGANVIPHKLSRVQQGWFFTDITAAATVYRSAPFNSTTLTLTSDAATTVNLFVF